MSYLSTLVTYQATQGKFKSSITAYCQITGDSQNTPLVETPKHTLEARAGQRVQTCKVNVIGILNLCSRSLTLQLARDTSTGVTVRVKFSNFATFINHFR